MSVLSPGDQIDAARQTAAKALVSTRATKSAPVVFSPGTATLRTHREVGAWPSPVQLGQDAQQEVGAGPVYTAPRQPGDGLLVPGNINLSGRPLAVNPDGSISTIRSLTVTTDGGGAVLIPSVVDGHVVSNQDAIDQYQRTGQHLGYFPNEQLADAYAQRLHDGEASRVFGSSDPGDLASTPRQQALLGMLRARREAP